MFKRKLQIAITESMIDRLFSRASRVGECLLWEGSVNKGGYGQINLGKIDGKQVNMLTHCLAWVAANGPIPDGMLVCHECDVRRCIHLGHLFLGSYAVNNEDARTKNRAHTFDGTHILGEKNHLAKLTEEQVISIRLERSMGDSISVIGARYGVSKQNIRSIALGLTWSHVPFMPAQHAA